MNDREKKFIPELDVYLFNTGSARKAWLCFGCRYIPELRAHRFMLWAPNARRVSLVGDFNGWDREATPMEPIEGGVWVCFVKGLSVGALYKFCVLGADGRELLKSDPFAAWGEHGENTASRVWDGGKYKWTDEGYMSRRAERDFMREPMSIYEVHPGSWRELGGKKPGYRELADSLAVYCKHMGFTHVELMPITGAGAIRSRATMRRPRATAIRTTLSILSISSTAAASALLWTGYRRISREMSTG